MSPKVTQRASLTTHTYPGKDSLGGDSLSLAFALQSREICRDSCHVACTLTFSGYTEPGPVQRCRGRKGHKGPEKQGRARQGTPLPHKLASTGTSPHPTVNCLEIEAQVSTQQKQRTARFPLCPPQPITVQKHTESDSKLSKLSKLSISGWDSVLLC